MNASRLPDTLDVSLSESESASPRPVSISTPTSGIETITVRPPSEKRLA